MDVLLVFFVLIWLAAFVGWVVGIVDVVFTPEYAYRQTGRDKATWVLSMSVERLTTCWRPPW